MAQAIEQLRSGLVVGHVGLKGVGAVDPIAKDVHDGDTVAVVADATLGCGSSAWTPIIDAVPAPARRRRPPPTRR